MKRTIKVAIPIYGFSVGKPSQKCCPCSCSKCKLCCRSPNGNHRNKGR